MIHQFYITVEKSDIKLLNDITENNHFKMSCMETNLWKTIYCLIKKLNIEFYKRKN